MRAYYFTSAKHGVDDIQNRRVKISRLSELNDPFELLGLDLGIESVRAAYADAVEWCFERFGVNAMPPDISSQVSAHR